MSHNQMDFVKGALIGGLIGGIAGLLIAPKAGKKLRQDISDGYNCLHDKTCDIADNIKVKGNQLLGRQQEVEEDGTCSLLTGGALGAVIGAIAALFLAPQSGQELREGLGDTYEEIREKAEDFVDKLNRKKGDVEDRLDDWKDTLNTLVEKLSSSDKRKSGNSKLGQIADWANLGIHLFQQLQKRR